MFQPKGKTPYKCHDGLPQHPLACTPLQPTGTAEALPAPSEPKGLFRTLDGDGFCFL